MATKETQELLLESIDFYMKSLMPTDKCPEIEAMRKIIKLDDLRKSLSKNE